MKRLIDAIIAKWFCLHNWKNVKEADFMRDEHDTMPLYSKILYQCAKCGKSKIIKI